MVLFSKRFVLWILIYPCVLFLLCTVLVFVLNMGKFILAATYGNIQDDTYDIIEQCKQEEYNGLAEDLYALKQTMEYYGWPRESYMKIVNEIQKAVPHVVGDPGAPYDLRTENAGSILYGVDSRGPLTQLPQ